MGDRFFVYIIKSTTSGKTYTGFTTDLENRLKQHNGNVGGYTKNRGPWEIVWFGAFRERQLAEKFEMYLKKGSGIAFARKRLIDYSLLEVLERISPPKLRRSEGGERSKK